MIKAMLIDDEVFALNELKFQLQTISNITIVGAFTNPFKGFFNIKSLEPDIIFLDIDMPETSGIYLAEQIVNTFDDINIVFVTAHDKYAINAFELHAVDYILKPFSTERIQKCISWMGKNSNYAKRNKINSLSEKYEESIRKFFVSSGDDMILVDLRDICYIEALNKGTQIRTKDKFYNSRFSLKYYESKLTNMNFYRAHRSYLVNIDKVVRISPKINYSFDIHFEGIPDFVPISRSNIKTLKRLLNL